MDNDILKSWLRQQIKIYEEKSLPERLIVRGYQQTLEYIEQRERGQHVVFKGFRPGGL